MLNTKCHRYQVPDRFRAVTLIIFALLASIRVSAENGLPIIDMHVHAYAEDAPYGIEDHYGNRGPATEAAHFSETYERLQKYNIVKAVVSGLGSDRFESVQRWKSRDTDNRLIRGLGMMDPQKGEMNAERFEELVKNGTIEIFGELGPYYGGTKLNDLEWQPYLDICQKYDIPVAVHTGGGDPGGTHSWAPKARLTLGDPYLLEDTLVKYPGIRFYMAHAGEAWHEHALRLMAYYPNLYTDISVLLWVEPMTQRYAADFLANAKQAGYLDRVMFGSDQMFWPDAIDRSIAYLNSLDFLSEQDKRGIFYDNAARFLKLSKE